MKIKFLTIGILFSILFFQGCENKKQEIKKEVKKEIVKQTVEINTMKKIAYPIWIDFSGKTQAVQNVNITSRVNGELKKIHFSNGDTIKKDQLLFTIDKISYKTILEQKEAVLQKDRASLKLAKTNLKRYTPLVKKGLTSGEKLDQLIAEQKQIEATIKSDKASVDQAKLDVEYCDIRATIDGDIGKALIDIGNIVNKNDKLANIVQSKSLYVNFSPSSKNVSLINRYKSQIKPIVKVIVGSQSKEPIVLTGKIDFVDTVSNTQTDTVDIRAIIHNDKKLLFAGTFVEIKMLLTDKLSLIALTPNNISQNQLGSYVLVVDKDNKIKTRQIEVGYTNSKMSIVSEGLNEGDKVVVSDITKLKNNQEVISKEIKNKIQIKDK